MTKWLALVGAAVACGGAWARDLVDGCWFYAGFDEQPTLIAGGEFPQKLDPAGLRPGKFGNAYYFHAPARNLLPPMADFLAQRTNFVAKSGKFRVGSSVKFSGGTLRVAGRHFGIANGTPWVSTQTGFTCSFYVKGRKDAELTAQVALRPLSTGEVAKISRRCGRGDWKSFAAAPLAKDECPVAKAKLTGDWQRVWCFAKFDNRAAVVGRDIALDIACGAEVELKDFQYQQTGQYPKIGNFTPGVYVDGGKTVKVGCLLTTDGAYTSSFPTKEGSFSAWVKCVEGEHSCGMHIPVWNVSTTWGFHYNAMRTCGQDVTLQNWQKPSVPYVWRHFAGTWKDGEVKYYEDGVLKKTAKSKFSEMANTYRIFRCGGGNEGVCPEALLDDVAIFSTALAPEEIAEIAKGEKALFADTVRLFAEPVAFTVFYRNQKNAALRTGVWVPAAATYTLECTVGGVASAPVKVAFAKGSGRLAAAFDPMPFRPGTYPWSFRLVDARGRVALERNGTLEIRGRFERDSFRVMSWGGSAALSDAFCHTAGIDTINCNTRAMTAAKIKAGFAPNIRYENMAKLAKYDYDFAKIGEETLKDLAWAEGLHPWTLTLANSEVQGAGLAKPAFKSARYRAWAEKALGHKIDWTVYDGTSIVNWKKLGVKEKGGIFGELENHPAYRTVMWFFRDGMPCFPLNDENAKAIHALSPGNLVWTEPMWGPSHADMMAEWFYEYDINNTLAQIRSAAAAMRPLGRPFMPTLGGGYWPELKGTNPKREGAKSTVNLGQTADECQIKAWMSLGAARADHLSFFGLDCWEQGAKQAVKWAAAPTNNYSAVAEPGAAAQFGAFMHTRFLPAAELLRGIGNVRMPVAYLKLNEEQNGSWFGWKSYWYDRDFTRLLGQLGVPYDVVGNSECTAEILAQYRYVIARGAATLTQAHWDALQAAAKKGTVVVFDSYVAKAFTNLPHSVKLPLKADPRFDMNSLQNPFKAWTSNELAKIRVHLAAKSDRDIDHDAPAYLMGSFTFEKRLGDVRYVIVVNNRRRTGGGIQTEFLNNKWYKPFGAPQTITTEIGGLGEETAVYEFNATQHDTRLSADNPRVTRDYAPGEGKVFAVYPRALKKLTLAIGGDLKAGGEGWVDVTVLDKSGNPAPGRQVVRLTLTAPDGTERDESGLYRIEGKTRIPLRFARGEEPGKLFKKWQVSAFELTSGLEGSESFRLTESAQAQQTSR